ncbi:hypothetical protein EST38_g4906 [Candolleomyces aberdarensis]|uniref:Secreted protein n=1 Tax=Candolleomyces aberdarensis TaxID=2316362 RepID=A0A4V1Q459_9AGAR|nr:hypothetical protein EST38_g4906 [Candolleomyces aberdarensis]
MLKSIVSLLTLASLAFAAPSSSLEKRLEFSGPHPPGFNITSLGVLGTGCPPGSAYYSINPDKTTVKVEFSGFIAEAGPGIAIRNNRKACQLTLGVSVPAGFAFGVDTVDYRGDYQLGSGVTASHQTFYYFQGQLVQATASSTIIGPASSGDYNPGPPFDLASTVTSPCGVSTVLNINSDVRVSNSANKTASGYISMTSILPLNLQWRTC